MAEQYIDRDSLAKIRANLWRLMDLKKMTLEDIQEKTKFSYSQVYRIIRGNNNMSVSGFLKVCQALNVPVSEVIDFEMPKGNTKTGE